MDRALPFVNFSPQSNQSWRSLSYIGVVLAVVSVALSSVFFDCHPTQLLVSLINLGFALLPIAFINSRQGTARAYYISGNILTILVSNYIVGYLLSHSSLAFPSANMTIVIVATILGIAISCKQIVVQMKEILKRYPDTDAPMDSSITQADKRKNYQAARLASLKLRQARLLARQEQIAGNNYNYSVKPPSDRLEMILESISCPIFRNELSHFALVNHAQGPIHCSQKNEIFGLDDRKFILQTETLLDMQELERKIIEAHQQNDRVKANLAAGVQGPIILKTTMASFVNPQTGQVNIFSVSFKSIAE